ncbi:YicC/YloC family endoribonuclease [Shimia sediminis]|uniref:YicC/YloC family endoribonuclease n=1 Tax=Shimia sediminis TaxID=2497945 RepID=UPI0013DFBD51|nr:YicC/YloC family endoribonuclease [Shimia sediminis]
MLHSMTGFAALKGAAQGYSWGWDLRSVNSKGLDLRLRVPDWIEGLEAALRRDLGKAMARGSVTLSLRVQKDEDETQLALNTQQLAAVLEAMGEVEDRAMERGLSLAPSKASDILGLKGVLDTASFETDTSALRAAILKDLPHLLDSFLDMRRNEGEALDSVLKDQLNQVETLTAQAEDAAEARRDETAANLRANLARVLDNTDGADEARVAQELAMIAVKTDVTEEIDRLRAHVVAARDLLAKGSPVGRKMDFLMQEFNREANTLCSKAQSVDLTRIGLDLKAVIDQMREQVQNVE